MMSVLKLSYDFHSKNIRVCVTLCNATQELHSTNVILEYINYHKLTKENIYEAINFLMSQKSSTEHS